MRLIDLSDNLDSTIEMLRDAAIARVRFTESCYDLTATEFSEVVGKLLEVSRLSVTLSELAVGSLGERDDD